MSHAYTLRSHYLLVALVASSCGRESPPEPAHRQQSVIYGEDNRTELFEHPDGELRRLGRQSVVALVKQTMWTDVTAWPSDIPTVTDLVDKCSTERFANQPSLSFCSGVLVDLDLVLTARHCVPNLSACRDTLFVFDYSYSTPGTLEKPTSSAIYRCREVQVAGTGSGGDSDFAYVRLDRPVTADRVPVPIRTESPVALDESVAALGFPEGTPMKVDGAGRIAVQPTESPLMLASLDTFRGSSGSGVFDAQQRLIGILIQGQPDYVRQGDCFVNRTLPEARGREVVRAVPVEPLAATGWRLRTTDTDGRCWSCRVDGDCPGHLACFGTATTGRWCDVPCGDAGACGSGQTCESGHCAGSSQRVCIGADAWRRNSCGRSTDIVQACGDGKICSEGGCETPSTCASPVAIDAPQSRSSVRPGGPSQFVGTCGGRGPEDVYRLDVAEVTRLKAEVTGYDTILYLRTDCAEPSSELDCNDDHRQVSELGSRIERELQPGRYFLFVDAFGPAEGDYVLTVDWEANDHATTQCSCVTARSSPSFGALFAVLAVALVCLPRRRMCLNAAVEPTFESPDVQVEVIAVRSHEDRGGPKFSAPLVVRPRWPRKN